MHRLPRMEVPRSGQPHQAVLDAPFSRLDILADELGIWLTGNVEVSIGPVVLSTLQLCLEDLLLTRLAEPGFFVPASATQPP